VAAIVRYPTFFGIQEDLLRISILDPLDGLVKTEKLDDKNGIPLREI